MTPTIIEHHSPNHSPRRADARVDTVLLHHTACAVDGEALNWLGSHDSGVSAHYVIGVRGHVYRLVPEQLKAWHAGKGRLPWETCPEYDFNHRSVGIEIVNPGDGRTPFTEAQYLALAWLVPDIVRRLGFRHALLANGYPRGKMPETGGAPVLTPYAIVLGHRDVAPGRKTDPADNFDWGRIRAALAGGAA